MDDLFDSDDILEHGLNDYGQCKGCNHWLPLYDLGLCGECREKLERDLIRQRDWDFSTWAFSVPPDKWENLRQGIVDRFGESLELLGSEEKHPRKQHRR